MRPVLREGSRAHAAFVAYQRAVSLGISGLKLRLIEAVARHGGHCWRANSDLAKQLGTAWNSSIWRVAQELVALGLLRVKRVLPGHRPEGVEKRYTHGTSSKFLDFKALGCPEAVADWRRPDTADRSPGPPRPPEKPTRPPGPPKMPEPAPDYLSPGELARLAADALAGLGKPTR